MLLCQSPPIMAHISGARRKRAWFCRGWLSLTIRWQLSGGCFVWMPRLEALEAGRRRPPAAWTFSRQRGAAPAERCAFRVGPRAYAIVQVGFVRGARRRRRRSSQRRDVGDRNSPAVGLDAHPAGRPIGGRIAPANRRRAVANPQAPRRRAQSLTGSSTRPTPTNSRNGRLPAIRCRGLTVAGSPIYGRGFPSIQPRPLPLPPSLQSRLQLRLPELLTPAAWSLKLGQLASGKSW